MKKSLRMVGLAWGFTLIEMLLVIAVIAVLVAMLVPVLSKSRVLARQQQCAANMRQHAMMLGMYASDCVDMIPTPNSPHKLGNNVFSTGNAMVVATKGAIGDTCPLAGKYPGTRAYPVNYGFFFWQGYVPALQRRAKQDAKLFQCPDTQRWAQTNNQTYFESFENASYTYYSGGTADLAKRETAVAGTWITGNWDCQPTVFTEYYFRGWANDKVLSTGGAKALKRVSDWKPDWGTAVDFEVYDTGWRGGQVDVHGSGVNIQFQDGSVKFGGKDIGAKKAYVFFSEKAGWPATNALNNGNSGYAYYGFGGTASVNLWAYYETGMIN
jgi:prepilin-type N-terminal cleavage/methylation domain-containing protein/prepilin-type processing-associated H-X9-DG protein